MTVAPRPLLAFGPAEVVPRPSQSPPRLPRPSAPGAKRQGERLTPQFKDLRAAFDAERVSLRSEVPDEIDPELVVVFDLAGSIGGFHNAVAKIEGLEFLAELVGGESGPDDDFYMMQGDSERIDKPVAHSLYLVMSNAKAIDELISLFKRWQRDPSGSFEHGLNKFRAAFKHLVAIRRWGAEDRIRETGLRERWEETLSVVGQSVSTVLVEVELWYRTDAAQRAAAEAHVKEVITASAGRVLDRSEIGAIRYHALLAELPIQQVRSVLDDEASAIRLLVTDDIMFVSPFTPMSVAPGTLDPIAKTQRTCTGRIEGEPRVALLDGLPFANHDALRGRLLIDDPDGIGEDYPIAARHHGTAMASLIVHGDLTENNQPLDRPLYVRPIMQPHQGITGSEQTIPHRLFTDVLHRAIRRIVEGEGAHPAAAPSVRVVNLSIGVPTRALTRRMSAVGRLLDWLAHSYNLLFVVSAGNHTDAFTIPAYGAHDIDNARLAAKRTRFETSLLRGILPPGDALNALTVGAAHADGLGGITVPDTAWDLTPPGDPALYGAVGPGVGRSVKPDIHHSGGRALYTRPIVSPGQSEVTVSLARTATTGPGLQVAAPGRGGATNRTVFTHGTSNAAALVTREASRLFDILDSDARDPEDMPLPDPQYHPLLVRAFLVHASSWDTWDSSFRNDLHLNDQDARRQLTALLGYGRLSPSRIGEAATNRAVLVAGAHIARDERHTYEFPLPPSLRAKAEWHRFTITLAFMAPTVCQLNRYRSAKVYFNTPDMRFIGGRRTDAEHNAVRRGSLQHEIVQGNRAMSFVDGDVFPIHVECMDDAQRLRKEETIRYALVVSAETAEQTSNTIYDEVRDGLRLRARERARNRIRP